MPASDTYIEKDSSVNDEIDRLRHSATLGAAHPARHDRRGLGVVHLRPGLARTSTRTSSSSCGWARSTTSATSSRSLVDMQYERNDMNLVRGKFRVRGDTIEVHPAYDETAVRIELFGDEVERIVVVDPLTGEKVTELDELVVFPATHYVTGEERMGKAVERIEEELQQRLATLREGGQAARGPAPADAHPVRPRDDARGRVLQRHRELLGPHRRAGAGRAAVHAARLLPRRLPRGHRREPRHGPAAPRPVRGRPLPQGHAGRARLPPAVGRRQPAAALRGVHAADRPGRLPVGHARPLRAAALGRGRRADRASHRPDRSPRSSSSPPRARSTT